MSEEKQENPYILPVDHATAIPDTFTFKRDSKWTVKDLSPQIKRKLKPKTSQESNKEAVRHQATDENGYEVPINFKRPIYMDFNQPTNINDNPKVAPNSNNKNRTNVHEISHVGDKDEQNGTRKEKIHNSKSHPSSTSTVKPNDSFLARYLNNHPKNPAEASQARPIHQCRRLPCSPPFLSSSLPSDWKGNKEESTIYEEIIPAFEHRQSIVDHDYVEIEDHQKYMLQTIKNQRSIASSVSPSHSFSRGTSSSSSQNSSDVENMWEKVAVPGVLRLNQ